MVLYICWNKNIDIREQDMFTIVPYTLTALGGSCCIFKISQSLSLSKFGKKKILLFLGNHTLEIMALHYICFKLISYMITLIYHLPIKHLLEFPVMIDYSINGWWIVYTLLGIIIPLGFAYIKNMIKNQIANR